MKTAKGSSLMNVVDAVSPFSLPSPSSDSAEPTPPPSRSATQSLRDSCDNCYKAKIKCSKTKPDCERCINRGFQCVYLPSRRRGRTKALSGRRTSQDSPTRSQRDPVDSGSQPGSTISTDDLDFLKNLPDFSTCLLPDIPAMASLHDTGSSPGFFSSSESAENLFSEPDISLSQDFFGTKLNLPDFTPSTSANLGIFTPPASSVGTPNGRKPKTFSNGPFVAHLDGSQCDCLSQSLEALNMLYRPTASWDSPPQFDMILAMNTWATNQCSNTLNCMRCSSNGGNSSLAMLMGTLLTKILADYQAAILGTGVRRESNQTRGLLGFFSHDTGAEQRLKLDLLRPELQRLQPMLGRFSELCSRVREESSTELFQSLPQSLETDFLNLTRLFQRLSQKLAGQGFGAQTVQ